MGFGSRHGKGFTLIELMVTVAVIVVLMMLAVPSFEGMRQRSAIRGADDQLLSFWNQARFEAVKRNTMVKVAMVQSVSAGAFCIGAATTTDPADTTPCDCLSATSCDVARFPVDQSEWNRVTLSGVTLGGGTTLANIEPAVIEPKRTALTVAADDGVVTLQGPPGHYTYKMNLSVDQFGRGVICDSNSASHHLPEFNDRRCSP